MFFQHLFASKTTAFEILSNSEGGGLNWLCLMNFSSGIFMKDISKSNYLSMAVGR